MTRMKKKPRTTDESPPIEYRAMPGHEDRDGEMTGAITFNMIFVLGPLTLWCVFIGPDWVGLERTLWIGLALAIVLSVAGIPVSRYFWARFSHWADRI